MKTLDFNQMESIEGGLTLKEACQAHNIAFGVSSLAALAFGIVCPLAFVVAGTALSLACEAA